MTGTGDRTASARHRYVLAGVVAALGVVTAGILLKVLGTILLALTVAYVLVPVHGWLVRRGLSEWASAIVATLIGFLSAIAVFSPVVVALYFRIEQVLAVVEGLPQELTITALGAAYTVEAGQVQALAVDTISSGATSFALALPVLAIKFALFVVLLFGLLLKGDEAGRAAVAPIPYGYRYIVYALATRARETLYAIYVLQVATSIATMAVAYPLFWGLGYDAPLTLSILAAVLQFVPIVGPSLLIAPIALYHVVVGDLVAAVLIGVSGLVLVGWLPDVAVRPRLARRSAGLSGSLYFVGFTGGLFTLGAIGVIVGPLIVAVFVEAVDLLADEVNSDASFSEIIEKDLETTPDDAEETQVAFEESDTRTADD
ncbi:AI-2E family transporter [Natrinema halophilum]|nr:AI-2E family transporter [Natrinema halophilum]QLG49760.2 AI-2E family transporter [Natrinema halophilum]